MPSTAEIKKLEAEATKLLRKAGYKADGQPKDQQKSWDSTGESVRAISTPMGGKSGYSRKRRH